MSTKARRKKQAVSRRRDRPDSVFSCFTESGCCTSGSDSDSDDSGAEDVIPLQPLKPDKDKDKEGDKDNASSYDDPIIIGPDRDSRPDPNTDPGRRSASAGDDTNIHFTGYSPAAAIGPPPNLAGGDYHDLRRRCLAQRALYQDPEFPANNSVLYKGAYVNSVRWKRPWEISKRPLYVQDGIKYPDINQGSLGNCWFISVLASLAASPQWTVLTRVIPRDQDFSKEKYCGAFRFFFWRYGKWVEVVIDDRLPTFNGRLIYAQNITNPEEYWCPLLEKAYAKFCGSYKNLNGGHLHTAMVDLSGGISEFIELKDKISDQELKQILLNCQGMNSYMGGSIFPDKGSTVAEEVRKDNGLYSGHGYSIIRVKEIRKGNTSTTLLHMRNPWGKGEWNGAWSDGSQEWQRLSPDLRRSTFKKNDDGEFWINLTDFRNNFNMLDLCHLTPDALTKEIADNMDRSEWKIIEHYGAWKRNISAGGPPVSFSSKLFWTNPQYTLHLAKATRTTTVVISLFRVDDPDTEADNDISIGFIILKLKEGDQPKRINAQNFYQYTPRIIATSGPFWPYRERTVRYEMEPADHVIIPCTYRSGKESKYYLRVFAEGELLSDTIDDDRSPSEDADSTDPTDPSTPTTPDTPVTPATPRDATDIAMDAAFSERATDDGLIDAKDLVEVIKAGIRAGPEKEHPGFNVETCRCLIGLADVSNENGLVDRQDVDKVMKDLNMWRKAFKMVDRNRNDSVDANELKYLFMNVDAHIGSEAIATILKRYAGKSTQLTEEDFLQSFCRSMLACRTYSRLTALKKIDMSLDEWLSNSLQA